KTRQDKSKATNPQPLTPNAQAEAEADFHKAIELARRQQAKLLELRATVSLSRLWQQQGKSADAYHMLAEVYEWFTEGFDMPDLQEERTLLKEMAAYEGCVRTPKRNRPSPPRGRCPPGARLGPCLPPTSPATLLPATQPVQRAVTIWFARS